MINQNTFLSKVKALLFRNFSNMSQDSRNIMLFTFEGVLITLVNNMINNNNNLFATRLGATDFQVSLVTSLPQFVGILVLIPGGILTDRMLNKRKMVIISLMCLTAAYIAIGFVPEMGKYRYFAFLILLSLSAGPMTMYNATWQAYFSDVVPLESMNRTYSVRIKGTFLISIIAPVFTGLLLASASSNSGKIRFHQSFFWAAGLLLIFQILVLKRITGGNVKSHEGIRFKDLIKTASGLAHNKRFMGFIGVALFFYMTWHTDWTLYFIGQVKYLKMNEAWLGYVNVGGALVQFLTISFWSRINEKTGVRFPIILGSLGLALCPMAMIIGTSIKSGMGATVFLILNTIFNFAYATVMLNILQCLIQVIPQVNKTLSISIYNALVTLSNAVMPIVGVQIYAAFGSDRKALQLTFLIVFTARIIATGLWALRWWRHRKEIDW
ncbi:MAG: MFS transporter [Bacillota bacterium]|nr:MFS transporter [Bacillota bacterium]